MFRPKIPLFYKKKQHFMNRLNVLNITKRLRERLIVELPDSCLLNFL